MLFLWPSYPCCHCANNLGWSEFAFTDCEGFCAVGWLPHTCLANLLLDCMAEPLFQLSYGVLDILRSLLRHKRLCTGSTNPNPWWGELSMYHTSFISFTVIHSRRVNLKDGPLLEARYCIACILHCAIVIDWLTCHYMPVLSLVIQISPGSQDILSQHYPRFVLSHHHPFPWLFSDDISLLMTSVA